MNHEIGLGWGQVGNPRREAAEVDFGVEVCEEGGGGGDGNEHREVVGSFEVEILDEEGRQSLLQTRVLGVGGGGEGGRDWCGGG